MLTMTPPCPRSSIRLESTACVTRNVAFTLTSITASRCGFLVTSTNGSGMFVPALLTRMSMSSRSPMSPPSPHRIEVTSQTSISACRPSEVTWAAILSRSCAVPPTSTRSAPASARAMAHAAPIPRPAPVTSARRPSRRNEVGSDDPRSSSKAQDVPNVNCLARIREPTCPEQSRVLCSRTGLRGRDPYATRALTVKRAPTLLADRPRAESHPRCDRMAVKKLGLGKIAPGLERIPQRTLSG